MTAYPGCAGLARSPFVLTEHISSYNMYGGTYAILVRIPRICNVGGVRPLIFFISKRAKRASSGFQGPIHKDFRYVYIINITPFRVEYR